MRSNKFLNKINSFIFFVLLFPVLFSHTATAQYTLENLSKEQSLHIIDSISHSNFRTIEKKFYLHKPNLTLESEFIYIDPAGIRYEKYFSENGMLQKEGLCIPFKKSQRKLKPELGGYCDQMDSMDKIGIWKFYTGKADLIREYNYNTFTHTNYSASKEENTDWIFDSLKAETKRFLSAHFGPEYYKKHIRINPYIAWKSERSSPEYHTYPTNMPVWSDNPEAYSVFSSIFYDTVEVMSIEINFNNSLKITSIPAIEDTASFYPTCLSVDYSDALKIAKANNCEANPYLEFDLYEKKYTARWITYITKQEPASHEKKMYRAWIDACTGRFRILPEPVYSCAGVSRSCPPASFYKGNWKDTLSTPKGWKKINFEEGDWDLLINLPENWIKTMYCFNIPEYYILGNTTDSLKISCTRWQKEKTGLPTNTARCKDLEDNFLSGFPNNKLFGRAVSMEILKGANANYSVKFNITEDFIRIGCDENCKEIYSLEEDNISTAQLNNLLNILKTVRFTSY